MARRSNRRSFSRGRKRPRLLWTGQSTTAPGTLTVAAGAFDINIVTEADYVAMATTEAGGTTCIRVVGSISVRADAAALSAFYFALQKKGTNEAGVAPAGAAILIDGDVMHFGCISTDEERTFHLPFDVRVKRKLETDRIIMTLQSIGAAHTYSLWARALLIGA